jgi:hypothetical protein
MLRECIDITLQQIITLFLSFSPHFISLFVIIAKHKLNFISVACVFHLNKMYSRLLFIAFALCTIVMGELVEPDAHEVAVNERISR